MERYILALRQVARSDGIGAKAQNLRFLMRRGFPIPQTHVCPSDAMARVHAPDPSARAALEAELAATLGPTRAYAVRSSANVEDSDSHSFAGQFASLLDLRGVDAVLQAMDQVWASGQSPNVRHYRAGRRGREQEICMAVIVQEMVSPVISGVAFSKNPLTGMDEVIVEAVPGLGTALMQEGITPARWVNKWNAWTDAPSETAIDRAIITQVVAGTRQIAQAYGRPVDLEWVYDGNTLYWVQLREITSLKGVNVYSNRFTKEMLPGVIKPLVWSINVPMFSGLWARLFGQMVGSGKVSADELIKAFYYRAYVNMTAVGDTLELLGLPREGFELMLGIEVEGAEKPRFKPGARTMLLIPRMARFAIQQMRYGHRVGATIPALQARFQASTSAVVEGQDERAPLDGIQRLRPLIEEIAYCNLVTQMFMNGYYNALKARLKSLALTPEALEASQGEAPDPYNLGGHLKALQQHYAMLDEPTRAEVMQGGFLRMLHLQNAAAFHREVSRFLQAFGHLSESSNDFSVPPWRENPDVVLKMIANYRPAHASAGAACCASDLELPLLQRALVQWLYGKVCEFTRHRNAINYLFTTSMGTLRTLFLALGERLVQRGLLAEPSDVFYLYLDEARQIASGADLHTPPAELVRVRRREIEQACKASPHSIIYGEQPPPLDEKPGRRLKGTPTSSGYYQGPVTVVRGMDDFNKVSVGDVLVIPHSDVAWTPLFANAGAVVSESGGILSHSSIVAREYGIPAVVSVSGACALEDNCLVAVDGYRGEVVVVA